MKKEIQYKDDNFGGRLQLLRNKKKLSRLDLFDKLAFHFPEKKLLKPMSKIDTIRKWESGASEPSFKELLVLCEVLDCDPNMLLGFRKRNYNENKWICELTSLPNKLVTALIKETKGDLIYPEIMDNENNVIGLSKRTQLLEQIYFYPNLMQVIYNLSHMSDSSLDIKKENDIDSQWRKLGMQSILKNSLGTMTMELKKKKGAFYQ